MARRTADLASSITQTAESAHPAAFPVALKVVSYRTNGSFEEIPNRLAVVREDTGEALALVSDRYTLVPHQRILDLLQEAAAHLDVGTVPQGIYVDRRGARMRALFKFPSLARPVFDGDEICPCIKVQNTYDGTSRIAVHIGAFRFVCTNLAVGGGGAFAGGFMAIHAGEIPIGEVVSQLSSYLAGFDAIVELYRWWIERPWMWTAVDALEEQLPKRLSRTMRHQLSLRPLPHVFDAYNVATRYATHQMRSYRSAFDLLERINRSFQEQFPLLGN